MTNLLDVLEPRRQQPAAPRGEFVLVRQVPFQPAGLPFGYVFMGAELGIIVAGGNTQIRGGDTVTVIGKPGTYVAFPRQRPVQRDPLFAGACKCKCAGASGLIFFVTTVRNATNVLVIDPTLDAGVNIVKQYLLPDVLNARSIAVDQDSVLRTLYLLDDRTSFATLLSDAQTVQFEADKNYWTLLTYNLSGDEYVLASSNVLPGANFTTGNHVGSPAADQANALSVVNGEVWITRATGSAFPPAGFFRWDGTAFTEFNLVADPFELSLFGPIVQVPDRPAPRTAMFISTNDGQVIQFDLEGTVLQRLDIPSDPGTLDAFAPVGLCNRLIAVQTGGTPPAA